MYDVSSSDTDCVYVIFKGTACYLLVENVEGGVEEQVTMLDSDWGVEPLMILSWPRTALFALT